MPFGLCNAPSTFEAIINFIFQPYLCKICVSLFFMYIPIGLYILNMLNKLLKFQGNTNFSLNSANVHLENKSEYLGHIVTSQEVKVDQGKIQAMLNWPRPTNISELCGFLGLTPLLPPVCS